MSLQVRKTVRAVGFGTEKVKKQVVSAQRAELVSATQLVEQISLRTGMPKGAVNNVLDALVDSVGTFVKNGHSVRIGRGGKDEEGLGILYPRLSRTRVKEYETDENGNVKHDSDGNDLSVTRVNLGVGIGLRPSVYFRQFLADISISDVTDDEEDEIGDDVDSGSKPNSPSSGTSNPPADNGTQNPSSGGGTTGDDNPGAFT